MAEQFTISGVVQAANNAPRIGMKVQAFDRDMPSVERRGSAPDLLGEAITDPQGGFKITYNSDQFQSGEGTSVFHKPGDKNADLSFRIFDRTGQELSINSIDANRPVGADQIIFNAPTDLVVNIVVVARQRAAISEYEGLLNQVSPIIEDVPVAELTDEDIRFILNELDAGQQSESHQRIQWLRRSAILAHETDLPVEAFYGWGRKDVPASLAELSEVPVKDLPAVLAKLSGLDEERLRESLLAAIAENIIPLSFRDRVDEIIRSLIRRDRVAREVIAQLLDVDTNAVLAGYTVTTFDQADPAGENRGQDVTDDQGEFAFKVFSARDLPPNGPPREFRLELVSPKGERLPEDGHLSVDLTKPEPEIFTSLIKVPKPDIIRQQEELRSVLQDVPPELRAFLNDEHNIQSFSDIRRKGGLSNLSGLPAEVEPVHIRTLTSLADLDRISPNISTSKTLLSHSFDSVLAVSDTPHAEFVGKVSAGVEALSEAEAVKLHLAASAQSHLLNNMLMKMAADNANGLKLQDENGAEAAEVFQQKCGCADCDAAVSPGAYLTALLDYALKHLRNNKNKVDLQFFDDTFHQPFINLPTDCESVEKQLHQVRVCVEVFRSNLGNRPLADPLKEAALSKAEGDYRFAVYASLLNRIGTSYEEVRSIRAGSSENRRLVAERLGFGLSEPRITDELDQLFLDPGDGPPQNHLLTEQQIERLFGLADTTRDLLSDGAKFGDLNNQITRWNLDGVAWGQNTDSDGLIHVSVLSPAPAKFRVELHRDADRKELVASGEIATAIGTVKLVPESDSRLSGVFEIAHSVDSAVISIAAIPALLSWKLKYLRTLWNLQDHPDDAYSEDAFPKLPVIDPDLLGPDDFRNPTLKKNPADPDKAFDVWLRRREFVDAKLSSLKADREAKGINEVLKQVFGDPLPDLEGLLQVVTTGGSGEEIKAATNSIALLNLSVDSLTRLMAIRVKDQLALVDPRNEKVSEQDWQEFYSILVQTIKEKEIDAWRVDEQSVGVRLGLEEFWFSVTEPKVGEWPPAASTNQPLIDPDQIKLTDLPEWLAGKDAIKLWKVRKARIEQIPRDLKTAFGLKGMEAMLRLALGDPAPGTTLKRELSNLNSNLGSPDPAVRKPAADQIATGLHLTIENFKRLMETMAADDQPEPAKKPTASELGEAFVMLAQPCKVKREYPNWIQEEKAAGLVYWKALKAKLPRWRASLESRQSRQQALRTRSEPPIIDPEVIGADDLKHIIPGDPAFDLWKKRFERVSTLHNQLKSMREASDPDALAGLVQVFNDALAVEFADLEALDEERQTGHSIEKRLDQLNLLPNSFAYLMRILGLAKANQPIVDSEWEIVYATLAKAKIEREFSDRHGEEKKAHIILGPELFKIAAEVSTPLPFLDLSAPRWLSTWQVRRDWQDKLQSRIDQEIAIIEGLSSAISAVEEATLPALRDALIEASDAVGSNLTEKAEAMTARLLIDARSGSCRTTTRVAQALETIQTLIYDLRSGQFKQAQPPSLSLVSDNFEEEWKWMGSYATWRSAMFVFLYPENILSPSLVKDKTPAFAKLIKNTRGLRINPRTACHEAEVYADYFRDVCSLEIGATCQASTVMYSGEGCDRRPLNARSMFYNFALAESGKVYWSAHDPGGSSLAAGQTLWTEVEGFDGIKVSQIVGALPYRKTVADQANISILGRHGTVQSAYIHLFCIAGEADKKGLKLIRLSLDEFGKWAGNGTAIDLAVPVPPLSFSSLEIIPVQTQHEFSRPGLVFHKFGDSHLYYRRLNADGDDWEQKSVDWSSFFFIFDGAGHIQSIKAALRVNSELLWFVNTSDSALRGLELSFIELRPGNKNPGVSIALSFGKAEFLGSFPGPEPADNFGSLSVFGNRISAVYIFWRDSTGSHYRRFSSDQKNNPVNDTLADLIRVVPSSGSGAAGQQLLAYQREKNARAYYMYKFAETGSALIGSETIRAAPRVNALITAPLHLSGPELQKRRQQIADAFALNADATASILTYLREAYYLVPLHLALALQSAGQYLSALDCFRTVYDYEAPIGPPNERNIYYGLEVDAKLPDVPLYQLADGWLLDPLNPHSIAATRHLTNTRFTIMSVVRCLLDFADAEFTQDTGESLATARTLYLTALDLLNLPELQQKLGVCDDLVAELKIEPGKDIPPEVPAAVKEILEDLTALGSVGKFGKVTKEVNEVFKGVGRWDAKLTQARAVIQTAVARTPLPLGSGAMVISKSSILKEQQARLLTSPLIDDELQAVSKTVAKNIFGGAGQIAPASQPNGGKILPALAPPLAPALNTPSLNFCIPANPILKALHLHAELNLYKLRNCRNIAGLKRTLDPYAAPTDTISGMPTIGMGGQLTIPGMVTLQPSLYRYPVLVERAKQLVQLAAQVEGAMLSAIERRDAEAQNLLQARQQLSLAQAGVRLQDLRVVEANDGVTLADLQQERAQIQIETYDDWLQTGPNEYENQMMEAYGTSAAAQKGATEASRMIQMKQAAISSAQLAAQIAQTGNPYAVVGGMVAGVTNLAIDDYLFRDLSEDTKKATEYAAVAQIASVKAAFERRKDEWQLQKRLAEQDSLISDQQKRIATDHVQIATQERAIAGIGADNARDSMEFLTNKFTNVELFDWMSNILEGVYSFFLQQATAMAKLAENQLAFERQEVPPACINGNYWELASENGLPGTDDQAQDRRGLTGSARLLQDIYQLDQYAFATNKRRLSLTKTISLSRVVPVEFERFRETGVLPFATAMEMFDRGFPGHYLRLIKRVRASVIALIPPIDGIHATLSTTGPSRVVIGGDVFQTVPIRRAPEFIAMSAPNNSTGVFELESQSDMLLPFEGSGVEMSWEFNLPRAANPFDYRTIADVLITLEYTALYSFDYRQQVIQTLKPTVSSDRPFSFRSQFADQWYDLHNPEQTSAPMTVRFKTLREDFPPNLEGLKIQHAVLYFVSANATSLEVSVSHLRYTAQAEPGTVGGSATSIDGIISTRRGNAGSWTAMIGKSPFGEWELALPNTEEMTSRFGDESNTDAIQDILLVITYSGRTPDWTT